MTNLSVHTVEEILSKTSDYWTQSHISSIALNTDKALKSSRDTNYNYVVPTSLRDGLYLRIILLDLLNDDNQACGTCGLSFSMSKAPDMQPDITEAQIKDFNELFDQGLCSFCAFTNPHTIFDKQLWVVSHYNPTSEPLKYYKDKFDKSIQRFASNDFQDYYRVDVQNSITRGLSHTFWVPDFWEMVGINNQDKMEKYVRNYLNNPNV